MTSRLRTLVLTALVACTAVLGACAQQPKPPADAGPPRDLGERAVFATTTTTTPGASTTPASDGVATSTSTTAAGAGRGGAATTTAPSGSSGSGSGGSGAVATATPAKPLGGSVTDTLSDNGLEAPDYADVATVALEDAGADLRATVTFMTDMPRTLKEGEVMGVGIDLFRTNERESDYQLFATGRADGWTAYLDTPGGFVKYPGTFTISGAALSFTVPWSAIGGHAGASFSTFADWSKAAVAVVAQTGQDSAPDQGTAPLA